MNNKTRIINTNNSLDNTNQNKCPSCGGTNIKLNIKSGNLICLDCRCEIKSEKMEIFSEDFNEQEGKFITTGASNILDDNNLITLKCDSCGAQVVIDTKMAASVKCHWCRNRLSIKNQIPNGSVPDAILPFSVSKEEITPLIESFLKSKSFFADKDFKKSINLDHIYGVYFPYIIVDAKYISNFSGIGEHEDRHYTITDFNDKETTYYDYDIYNVKRKLDMRVMGLTIESSQDKLSFTNNKTNNIINSIMPFDIDNCVKWNSNYLVDYSLEKRDVDIDDISSKVYAQLSDIARIEANNYLCFYDRGVFWNSQDIDVKAERWKTAYMPVWLYSFSQKNKNGFNIYYIAVNGRTKELMGSIPLNKKKLFLFSSIIEIICFFISLFFISIFDSLNILSLLFLIFMLSLGFVYYKGFKSYYSNKSARHYYEKETKRIVDKVQEDDFLEKSIKKSTLSRMKKTNNKQINGNKDIDFSKKKKKI